jgi:hypothetical protein
MSTTPLHRRTAVAVLAAALFTSMLIPGVQAASTPGAKCTQRGQERVVFVSCYFVLGRTVTGRGAVVETTAGKVVVVDVVVVEVSATTTGWGLIVMVPSDVMVPSLLSR